MTHADKQQHRQDAIAALAKAKAQARPVTVNPPSTFLADLAAAKRKVIPKPVRLLKPRPKPPIEPQTRIGGYVLIDTDRQIVADSFRTRKSDTIKTVAPGGGRSKEWNSLTRSGKFKIKRAVIQLK